MSRKRDLWIVAGFAALSALPFQGKGFHIDEPFFIAVAEVSLGDSSAALRAGATAQKDIKAWPLINNNPPMIVALLNGSIRLVGTNERALRLLLFPLDLLAALSLYLIARRFLKQPLWPTLTILAGPAYWLNVGHLMGEKPALAFGFAGIYALLRGVDDDERAWFWGSAFLLAGALLSKYIAVFFLPTAAFYCWRRGVAWTRIAGYAAIVASGLGVCVLMSGGLDVFRGVATVTQKAGEHLWSASTHWLRSVLAFVGGCSVIALIWPLALGRWKAAVACLLAAAALFLPSFDLAPVRLIDRLTGIVFAAAALLSVALLADQRAKAARGRPLWLAWIATSLFLIYNYWSVMGRTVLMCLPALTLAWAEILEINLGALVWKRLQVGALALTASLGLAASIVDLRYANAQRDVALAVAREFPPSSRRVWCAAHLGLRHYLLKAGARELDAGPTSWEQVKPGDVVVLSKTNNAPPPRQRLLANVRQWGVDSLIPVRLISGFGGEGGFYSNISGFLPYSFSVEPVERFDIVELR